MQLVEEQDDLAIRGFGLGHDSLEPLLKLTAELRAGDEQAHVQRNQTLALERFGHLTRRNPLSQSFDHGGFAYARLANQHRVVLRASHQDLHQPQDLFLATNDGIQFLIGGERRQIDAVLLQGLERALRGWAVDRTTTAYFLESACERRAAQSSLFGG